MRPKICLSAKGCSGDVHLAAVGQFYSNPNLGVPKDRDHRYMANIVSSAIVNTPPSNNMADILNRRNKTHHFDHETDEDMIPMFTHDVNGHPRNNKHLLPRRNWCSIREYHPGTSPPPTPPESEPQTPSDEFPPPPTRLQRTLSLTRGDVKPGNLLRRFSKMGHRRLMTICMRCGQTGTSLVIHNLLNHLRTMATSLSKPIYLKELRQ